MDRIRPRDKPKELDNVVITCMDHRYQEDIKRILQERYKVDIDHVDRLAIGGASKAVVDGTFTLSLQIACKEHRAKNVFIFDHIDCGGFGGLQSFDNDETKEAQAHFESLNRAQEVIHNILPELVVVTYVIGLDGEPIEN